MIRRRLQKRYAAMKQSYLSDRGFDVPARYQSAFVHWGGGVEAQYIVEKLIGGVTAGGRILVVGVEGGRDYYLLRNLGFDVVAFDLGTQPDIAPIEIGNVEDELPFERASFDAVLVGEVLEHLERDVDALRHLRRVMRDDARLLVTVPFYNDWERGHTRIHSPESARRLLALGGFTVVDYVERPALVRPNALNPVQHAINLASFGLRGRTAYGATGRVIGAASWRLGHALWLRPLRRMNRGYGGYFLCAKGETLDHVELTRALHTQGVEARA